MTVVRIVVDARKSDASIVHKITDIAEDHPGDARLVMEIRSSSGPFLLAFHGTIEAGEPFYAAVRELGWTAIPET